MLSLFVICLLMIVIVPTYAKFGSSFDTEDIAGFAIDFNVSITNIDEYEEVVIEPGSKYKFNVDVTNNSGKLIYYGIWYRMVKPEKLGNDIFIGRLSDSLTTTSGSIEDGESTIVTIAVINNSDSVVTLDVGVATSETGIGDIEFVDGKYLINKEVDIPADISIVSITIDGISSVSLPTGGYYEMEYVCSKGSKLKWDTLSKTITYGNPSYVMDECSLTFKSSDNYPLLNTMTVGDYVAYVGDGGFVGNNNITCEGNDIEDSTLTTSGAVESSNSCSGKNVREELETFESGVYGYCYSSNYKYYTSGWRIAYIDDKGNPVIVSGGSPECINRRDNMFEYANTKALKYCNADFVDGDCVCDDVNSDGLCDNALSDAWVISDSDFYYMTKAISGYGKRLTNYSSELGDVGGNLNSRYCYSDDGTKSSYKECGYNNDLLDNGGLYWFVNSNDKLNNDGIFWHPFYRSIQVSQDVYAYGLRPMIRLSSTVKVTGGSGTLEDPYTIVK